MNTALLKKLCETPGIAGREDRVRNLVKKEIRGLFDEVRTDALGSLICTRYPTLPPGRGKKPTRIMLAAHMDEIGFYVSHIDDRGFIWVNPAGGFDARNLFSRRVLVCCDTGDYEGVMNPGGKPVHIARPEERRKIPEINEFSIDLGMPAKEVKKKVEIGDFVVMHEPFLVQPDKFVSKAIDNRIGSFLAIEALRKLHRGKTKAQKHAAEIVVAFTVQEEVGLRGAMTAAFQVDADLGVALDTTLACDTPGIPDTLAVTRHGKGVGIGIQDSSMIADHALVKDICTVAKRHKIPFQKSILPCGGQDGAAIQRAGRGARTVVLSVGTRYIHTVTESIDKGDLEAAIKLLVAWLPTIK